MCAFSPAYLSSCVRENLTKNGSVPCVCMYVCVILDGKATHCFVFILRLSVREVEDRWRVGVRGGSERACSFRSGVSPAKPLY